MRSPLTLLQKSSENILRNWVIALPTILVMAIVLTMFHGLLVVYNKAQETIQSTSQKFSITVYLKDSADPFAVGDLINSLEKRSDVVVPVVFTSKEAALEMMQKNFFVDSNLLKKYKFSLPASLTITLKNPDDTVKIEAFLQTNAANILQDPTVTKDKQKAIASQMLDFIKNVKDTTSRTLVFFILFFIIGGTLLLSSTIHMAISARHVEIGIMKLVGASSSKITTPFVVEGALLGLFAFAVHFVLLAILPIPITDKTLHFNALILEFAAIMLLSVTVSYLTTVFHIKKKHAV